MFTPPPTLAIRTLISNGGIFYRMEPKTGRRFKDSSPPSLDLTLRTADPEIGNPELKAEQLLHSLFPLPYQEPSTLLLLDPPASREPPSQNVASHSLHHPSAAPPADLLHPIPQLFPAQASSQYSVPPNVQTYASALHSFDQFRGQFPSLPSTQSQTNIIFPYQQVDDSGNSGPSHVTESKPSGNQRQGTIPQGDIHSRYPPLTRIDSSGVPPGEGRDQGGGYDGTGSVRKEESWERLRGPADGMGQGGEADGVELRRDPSSGDDSQFQANKKLRLSSHQSCVLEEQFNTHRKLTMRQKTELGDQLQLSARQVEVWFQNRRARTKARESEEEAGFLKQQNRELEDDNAKLRLEIRELKAARDSSSQR